MPHPPPLKGLSSQAAVPAESFKKHDFLRYLYKLYSALKYIISPESLNFIGQIYLYPNLRRKELRYTNVKRDTGSVSAGALQVDRSPALGVTSMPQLQSLQFLVQKGLPEACTARPGDPLQTPGNAMISVARTPRKPAGPRPPHLRSADSGPGKRLSSRLGAPFHRA